MPRAPGTKTAYYWGNAIEKDRANCAGCNTTPLNKTVATGTFPPNAFGLIDMAGNAAEWVEDCWEDNYKAAPKDGSAFTKAGLPRTGLARRFIQQRSTLRPHGRALQI